MPVRRRVCFGWLSSLSSPLTSPTLGAELEQLAELSVLQSEAALAHRKANMSNRSAGLDDLMELLQARGWQWNASELDSSARALIDQIVRGLNSTTSAVNGFRSFVTPLAPPCVVPRIGHARSAWAESMFGRMCSMPT